MTKVLCTSAAEQWAANGFVLCGRTPVDEILKQKSYPDRKSVCTCFPFQAFFNNFIPDHEPDVFNPPSPDRPSVLDKLVTAGLSGFRRWDAIYFLHIAEHGYTYENTLAFFPLFPLLIRLTADSILYPLQYIMNTSSVLLISASLINFWFFIQAATVFYELTVHVLRDETLAFKAAQLFCINPASIFFSACYSEALYCWMTLLGMLHFERKRFLFSALFFALSGATRSNGIVNTGFLLYAMGIQFLQQITSSKSRKRIGVISITLLTAIPSVLYTAVVLTPYLIYQYFAYSVFCNPDASEQDLESHILTYGSERGYKMPHTGLSPYCHWTLPFSYSYVQSSHWGVGFLTYYEYRNIPNFMLAAPIVAMCMTAIVIHCKTVLPRFFADPLSAAKKSVQISKEDSRSIANQVLDAKKDVPKVLEVPKEGTTADQTQSTLSVVAKDSKDSTEPGHDSAAEQGQEVNRIVEDTKESPNTTGGAQTVEGASSGAVRKRKGMPETGAKKKSHLEEHSEEGMKLSSANDKGETSEERVKQEKEKKAENPRVSPESDTALMYFCQEKLLVYIVHLLFLTIVAVFFMHVQVQKHSLHMSQNFISEKKQQF